MVDIEVRLLAENEWQLFRDVRLAALRDAPEAFVARHDDEAAYDQDFWCERMGRATRIVAERADEPVGLVCVGLHNDDPETGEVFGLWTAPTVRGQRVARGLVTSARQKAASDGCKLLYFWVDSNNASAVAFASSFGFRPTEERRPVRIAGGDDTDQDEAAAEVAAEVAMVLPLLEDPTRPRNRFTV